MKVEEQVTSLDLSKKLKELGVKQESLFHWVKVKHGFSLFFYEESVFDISDGEGCSAFTSAELGEMLPSEIWHGPLLQADDEGVLHKAGHGVWYENDKGDLPASFDAEKEADARAKMFIYLIENNLLKL